MNHRSSALFAIFALLEACGGKSEITRDDVPAGGSGMANGGNASTVSSGGGGSTVCPSAAPALGTACNYIGDNCFYEISKCSSRTVTCRNGVWLANDPVSGASYTCANFSEGDLGVPKDGASCDCLGMLDCTINQCEGAGRVHAVCDDTSWRVTTTPCADTACGPTGLTCNPGEVCVGRGIDEKVYACKADPCAAQNEAPSCDCAGSICASYEECEMDGPNLFCFYPI